MNKKGNKNDINKTDKNKRNRQNNSITDVDKDPYDFESPDAKKSNNNKKSSTDYLQKAAIDNVMNISNESTSGNSQVSNENSISEIGDPPKE